MKVGQLVLLYLPIEGKPLATKLHGPYEIIEKQGPVNYRLATPDRRKKILLCHINLLRAYIKRNNRSDTNYIARNLIIQNDWNKQTLTEIIGTEAEIKSLTDLPTDQRRSPFGLVLETLRLKKTYELTITTIVQLT